MKSDLDIYPYTEWYVDGLMYKDELLSITVEASQSVTGRIKSPKKFLVIFSDAITFQKYEEAEHFELYKENRTEGVIGVHKASVFTEFLKSKTMLYELIPGNIIHYSLVASNECFHILSRVPPKIVDVS